ncbi:MAG: bifunctional UDP-4-keto-pentose/UDP-xylose synthase [bacterium]
MKVLILGVNGFIGNSLTYRIMTTTDWEVYGMDMACDKLEHSINNPRFHFVEGDISINKEWIEYHIKKSDLVLPLVAIATPASYVQDPLAVFELDFEENLRIVRQCVKYKKRVIFPSTSEVYGMCSDPEFEPETSNLVLGPIHKERWIYSCSKQLMDRVIWAYGRQGLQFSLIRPFNWIGPKLDRITVGKEGSSRVLTQFLGNIMIGEPIKLVDGGTQSRSFTYIDDGISCLMKIMENKDNVCQGEIFNIGNPDNNISIRDLAHTLREMVMAYPKYRKKAEATQIIEVSSENYYGKGYQDIMTRVPSIRKARELLGWKPEADLKTALKKTLDYYLTEDRKEALL